MLQTFVDNKGLLVLSKQQQQRLFGGISQDPISDGTCAAQSSDGGVAFDQISKADAIAYASANHTHWCCDSCATASWYFVDEC